MPVVNPNILIWARESMGFSLEDAARKLRFKDGKRRTGTQKLLAFERGEEFPTRSNLVSMAKAYHKPLLTFYITNPPRQGDRGEDFRALPQGQLPEDNVLVDVLIRDVRARQSLLRETLIDENEASEVNFIDSLNRDRGVIYASQKISRDLGFDLPTYRAGRSENDAFRYLRKLAEDAGIYVLLMGNLGSSHTDISTKTFRGFVLSDDIAPFIIINDLDSKAAWCFTLLHEIVHLYLGQSGISGSYAVSQIEKFCNDVASEILLPNVELDTFDVVEDLELLVSQISDFAGPRSVSSSLVAYRLYRQGLISEHLWREVTQLFRGYWNANRARQRERNREQDGGPSAYVVKRHKLGSALVDFANRMISSGALTATKAGTILGIRPLKVHKFLNTADVG